jgi:D-allose transport system permease protein
MVAGMNPFLAVLIGGVFTGVWLGGFNGLLVNYPGLHPFIITLGTNAIFRGLTMIISGANPVYGFPYEFIQALTGNLWIIPAPVLLALSVAAVLWFLSAKTRLGGNIYALGGNREAAYFSGIDIKLHTLIVFVISGVCSGLAGVLSAARLGAAEPGSGQNFETFAIASAIIGGTSFFGGKGRIPSVVIGGLIIGTISNGLNVLQIPTFYQLVVMGSLIIAAVSLDRLIGRAR